MIELSLARIAEIVEGRLDGIGADEAAATSVTGTVAQWFHVSAIAGHTPSGRKMRKVVRKREVCRV